MARAQRCDAVRNRDRLVEAAADAFSANGVETSLEEIARTAGVGIGTLYRHFPTREALLEAVFQERIDGVTPLGDELLEVAAEAFAARGVDASLEEIARTAGVGVGTL